MPGSLAGWRQARRSASAPIWRQLFGADDIDFNDLRRHTLVLLDRGLELDHAK